MLSVGCHHNLTLDVLLQRIIDIDPVKSTQAGASLGEAVNVYRLAALEGKLEELSRLIVAEAPIISGWEGDGIGIPESRPPNVVSRAGCLYDCDRKVVNTPYKRLEYTV